MRFVSLALSLAVCTAALGQDADKVTLQWKFKKGESVRYEIVMGTEAEVSGMEIKQDMLFGMSMEATEVADDGVATVKFVYDRVKIRMSGVMETDFDSDEGKKADDPMGRMMGAFVGKSFSMKMNPRGEVLEVKDIEKLMEEVAKELGDDDDPMVEAMKQMYSDDQMKQMMQQFFVLMPGKPVAKGDSWESKHEFGMPQMPKMEMKNKATLKEIRAEGKEAVIARDTKLETKSIDGSEGMVEVKDGKMDSEVVWAVERGLMQSMKGKMTFTMSAGGQDFEMTMKSEMKLAPREKKKEY